MSQLQMATMKQKHAAELSEAIFSYLKRITSTFKPNFRVFIFEINLT